MSNAWLTVPHVPQTSDGYCLDACVCMVLAYWGSPVTEAKVSQLLGSEGAGVPASRVRRLAQWGYKVSYETSNLSQLQHAIQRKIPIIALVDTQFLEQWDSSVFHAILVVGIDNETVIINDPAFPTAPHHCSLNGFLAAWVEMNEYLIAIEPTL